MHNKITIGSAALLMVGGFAQVKGAKNGDKEDRRSNIVFVMSDQQSFDMLGCYGNRQVITPNLDRFASQGIKFTNCFSNSPISTPYRGMLLSGQIGLLNGTFGNDNPLIPGNGKKFAEMLTDAGYSTAYVGKWHLLGGDRDRPIPEGKMRYGFDELFYTNNCHLNYEKGECFYWDERGQKVFFNDWEVYGQTRQAVNYLDSRKGSDKPFALFVSWHPPRDYGYFIGEDGRRHFMYDAPQELMSLYGRDTIKMRPGLESTPDRRRMYHGHMAMIAGVDNAFGELMDKLTEIGADENTLVVFTADHGDLLESYRAKGPKALPHDYSSRVPLLVRMPQKLPAASESSLLVGTLDLMPTLLGLLDLKVPRECQGNNLARAIVERDEDAVEYIPMWMYLGIGWRGVITKEFTYTVQRENPKASNTSVLFDRKADPAQLKNLFGDPAYAKQQAKMHRLTRDWMSELGDQFWGQPDFDAIATKAEWGENTTQRPIDLLKRKNSKLNSY